MKRKYYGSLHEKLDRILELLEKESYEEGNIFPFGCPEPIPQMEYMYPEGRNDQESDKIRIETHNWNSPNHGTVRS